MTVAYKKALLNNLRVIEKRSPDVGGICLSALETGRVTLYKRQYVARKWLYAAFRCWPEFSGSQNYPVPAPKNWDWGACGQPYHHGHLWEGEYGAARKRLLSFLIAKLEKELKA